MHCPAGKKKSVLHKPQKRFCNTDSGRFHGSHDPGRSSDLQIIPQPRLPIITTVALCGPVPAYSVGPTLRTCTVFPFHRQPGGPATPWSSLL